MTTALAALFGILALAAAWWRRRARRAEADRDQARGERDVAQATAGAIAADAARKVDARTDERAVEAAASAATAAGDPHPERAAARERAAASVRRKIASPRKRGAK